MKHRTRRNTSALKPLTPAVTLPEPQPLDAAHWQRTAECWQQKYEDVLAAFKIEQEQFLIYKTKHVIPKLVKKLFTKGKR